jgi:hypothetical protein
VRRRQFITLIGAEAILAKEMPNDLVDKAATRRRFSSHLTLPRALLAGSETVAAQRKDGGGVRFFASSIEETALATLIH